MKRFEIKVTRRLNGFYWTMTDLLTGTFYSGGSKRYNSEGAAKEAASLVADAVMVEDEPTIHEYGPEI